MQYFHTVHYHCSVLGVVPIAHETIYYTQSTNKYTTNSFNKHIEEATHYVKDDKYTFQK